MYIIHKLLLEPMTSKVECNSEVINNIAITFCLLEVLEPHRAAQLQHCNPVALSVQE